MAKNDRVLLDGIIDDRVAMRLPSDKRDEAFEYLAFEQVLKDFDLSSDELLAGTVDGRQDGGIDGFFILVNGHLLQEPDSFVWPRTNSDLKVVLISSKHHDTFRQATLDALIATLTEILDFAIQDNDLKGAYSPLLLRMRSNLQFAYRKLSPRLASFSVDVVYASRGGTSELGHEVRARAQQIEKLVHDYFGASKATMTFLGCTELVELHRRIPNYTLELPFVEALAKGEQYVVLAKLSDYFRFVTDEGKLRRYLFESNVRDFMGMNRVNEDIKSTLESRNSPDFWWLNNGVTILATAASMTGKSIQVADIQIVNGLQTTESIYRHFENCYEDDQRCLMVKVIVSRNEEIRDAIIRATNNQTDVELASLHATDKVQRDIEEVMLRHGLFYERRKNFYANQGQAPAEIVTPLYAAAGYVALVLKQPHRAMSLRSKFMRSSDAYDAVFSEKSPIEVWPKICQLLKRIDIELEVLRPQAKWTDKFLKGWRYMVAFALVSEVLGKFTFSSSELLSFDLTHVTPQAVEATWRELTKIAQSSHVSGGWSSRKNVVFACSELAKSRGIAGIEMFRRDDLTLPDKTYRREGTAVVVSDKLVELVRSKLPPQPWKPGTHRRVAAEVGCDIPSFFAAVDRIMEEGSLYRQKDGVLYDADGNVVAFDLERVDPETLNLRGGNV